MAYINGNRRINPLDINKNVTIGVAFPLNDVNMFKGTQTVKEQVKSNLINLLLTSPGERLYIPNYGVGLKKLLFEPNIDQENLDSRINQQINFYIPEISLIETQIKSIKSEHKLYINISYRSNLDGSNDAIQLNFN
jgi:phage baseplate assembly protein W